KIQMNYYNNRNFFIPHCKPARKATPKMDISTDTGRSTSNPVESANDCITKSFFWALNQKNQLQLYNHLWVPEIINIVIYFHMGPLLFFILIVYLYGLMFSFFSERYKINKKYFSNIIIG
ncbi:hypothetical protein ALC56_02548, partial [Trachymyrmex septentrionalis]